MLWTRLAHVDMGTGQGDKGPDGRARVWCGRVDVDVDVDGE